MTEEGAELKHGENISWSRSPSEEKRDSPYAESNFDKILS